MPGPIDSFANFVRNLGQGRVSTERQVDQSLLEAPPRNVASGPRPRLPTSLTPAMDYTPESTALSMMNPGMSSALPRLTMDATLDAPASGSAPELSAHDETYNSIVRRMSAGRTAIPVDEAQRISEAALRSADAQAGLAAERLREQSRLREEEIETKRSGQKMTKELRGDEIAVKRRMAGAREREVGTRERAEDRATSEAAFRQNLDIAKLADSRGVNAINAWATRNKLSLETQELLLKVHTQNVLEAKELGLATPGANSSILNAFRVLGGQPGPRLEELRRAVTSDPVIDGPTEAPAPALPGLPSPTIAPRPPRAAVAAGIPADAVPLFSDQAPAAAVTPATAGPIGGENDAAGAQKIRNAGGPQLTPVEVRELRDLARSGNAKAVRVWQRYHGGRP